jgi:TolB-like protein/tRNA A-37 threonylcarbamoyl transferase component Bud32/Flp pilus assembly protein TadD
MVPVSPTVSHYRLLELLGEGSMGAVYRAEDLMLGRTVAVKALKHPALAGPTERARFLREARAISDLDHPNIVTLFEALQDGEGLYLVMQYVRGRTLRAILGGEGVDAAQAVRIACEVTDGLRAAHAHGLVHRDLKPENVMVTPEGHCKVLDFGVAHLVDSTTITRAGEIVGTLCYMAPEQLQGRPVDARADLYSLGVVLFEMLTRRLPFEPKERGSFVHDLLTVEAPRLSTLTVGLPAGFDEIVARALAKEPEHRYPDANSLLHDLEIVRARLAASAPATDQTLYAQRWTRSRRRAQWAGLGVLLVALALLGPRVLERAGRAPAPRRIMVAPFDNTRGVADLEWLSSGIMDGLIGALGRVDGYTVVSRTTVMSALEVAAPQAAGIPVRNLFGAAREAKAAYLVSGNYTASGGRIRINCELQDLDRGAVVASWPRELHDLDAEFFGSVDTLAGSIAQALRAPLQRVTGKDAASPAHSTSSVEAMRFFEEGLRHYQRHDTPAARASFQEAVAADSSFAHAYLYLARLALDEEGRLRFLTLAMKYRHGAPQTLRDLVEAEWFLGHQQYDEAARRYEQILAEHPEEVDARVKLARVYMRRRQWLQADAEFNAVREHNPFDTSFFADLTICSMEIGRPREALRLCRQWRQRLPDEAFPLMWTIQLQGMVGDYGVALGLCDTLALKRSGADLPYRAVVLLHLGRMRAAEQSLVRWQENPGGYFDHSRPLAQLAYLDYVRGETARGQQRAAQALQIQDDWYNRWIAGLLSVAAGDLPAAQQHALAIADQLAGSLEDSTTAEALTAKRYYYNLEGKLAEAERDLPRAVRMHRRALTYSGRLDEPLLRTALGEALLAGGDPQEAAGAAQGVLAFNPNYPDALLLLGQSNQAQGDRAGARAALERLRTLWTDADSDYVRNVELAQLLGTARAEKP